MNEIFGLQTRDLMLGIAATVAVILLIFTGAAWRNPLLFRLGLRNIPRRRAQSVLIVVGLMLSTIIVAAAFTTGDTLSSSLRNTAFDISGRIDHLVQFDTGAGRSVSEEEAMVPQTVAADLQRDFATDPDIVGFTQSAFDVVSFFNVDTRQLEPLGFLLGLRPEEVDAIGGIPAAGGGQLRLGDLGESDIILNQSAARNLAAAVGQTVEITARREPHRFTVVAIARDTLVSGQVNPQEPQGAVIHLAAAQRIFHTEGELSGIGATVRGGVEGALARSAAVDQRLNAYLDRRAQQEMAQNLPPEQRVYADASGRPTLESEPFKQDAVDNAELFGSLFTTLFLVMGLFSIAAGVLLIFLIFVLLAEERKPEMGMARAVGMRRGQLVQTFIMEGLAYNAGSAAVGTALGVLVAFGMVEILDASLGEEFGFHFVQQVTARSLVIASGLGIIVTFITVVVSAFRVSHLNITAAIRDLPDSGPAQRRRISIAGMFTTTIGLLLLWLTPLLALLGTPWLWVPGLGRAIRRRDRGEWVVLPLWTLMRWRAEWWFTLGVLGLLLTVQGMQAESAFLFLTGTSFLPLAALLLVRRLRDPGRAGYTLVGATLLVWWLAPQNWLTRLTGVEFGGGPELFVLSGIMMVTGATLVVVFNLDWLLGSLRVVGALLGRLRPAVHMAAAYPSTARYRTGMTIAMIAIIMFALVTFTTINQNFARLFTSDAAAGGYAIQADANRNQPFPDLETALREAGHADVAAQLTDVSRLSVGATFGTDIRTVAAEQWDDAANRPIRTDNGAVPFTDAPLEYLDTAYDASGRLRAEARNNPDFIAYQRVFLTGGDAAFLRHGVALQSRTLGFATDAEVWAALRAGGPNGERYAVVSANAVTADNPFADDDENPFELPDTIDQDSRTMPAVRTTLRNASTAAAVEVTIIGVLDQVVSVVMVPAPIFLPTLITSEDTLRALYADADLTRHLARVGADADPLAVAQSVEAALRVQTVSIVDELEDQQSTFNAILLLFQGFTALGLLAGLAALGVIAVRSVVERRQQIGVLRAIGYQRGMVRLELLLEMLFIAGTGILTGTALAVALAWRLFDEGAFGSTTGAGFSVPVGQIAAFAAFALGAALLMTWLPARQASRVPVAEALRYE